MPSPDALPLAEPRLISLRAVLLGLLGVVSINLLAPHNNYVVDQTGVVGNSLSIAGVFFCLVLVGGVNAAAHRWTPRYALRRGEIAVALGMVLVGCCVPGVGLFRYLPGHLLAPFYWSAQRPEYAAAMASYGLADWLFPTFASADPAARGNDPVVQHFYGRIPPTGDDSLFARVAAVPWGAWVMPLATWGIFLFLLLTAVLCLTVIFRRQWVENERLAFPLATVYGALIEPPEPGRAFNRLFRSPAFLWAAAGVFVVHLFSGFSRYVPDVPAIPLTWDLRPVFAGSAFWSTAEWFLTQQQVYFTVIGIAFFLRTSVLTSLIVFCLAGGFFRMVMLSYGSDFTTPMQADQQLGSGVVVLGATLWVARRHLAAVGRQMIGRPRRRDPRGLYLPYALAAWGVVASTAGMVAWLVLAGVSAGAACVYVAVLMGVMLLVGRVVAETGVLYVLIATPATLPITYASTLTGAPAAPLSSFFFGRLLSTMFLWDTRESLPNYATTALRVADASIVDANRTRRRAVGYVLLLGLALLIAYVTASGSTLYFFYHNAATLGQNPVSPLSPFESLELPQRALDETRDFAAGIDPAARFHGVMFGSGAIATLLLTLGNLRFAGWPLSPVGFLLATSWGMKVTWFSLLLGLIIKLVLVRLAGSRIVQRATPLFIGLVVGEVVATAFWMIVALVLARLGIEFHVVQLLPR